MAADPMETVLARIRALENELEALRTKEAPGIASGTYVPTVTATASGTITLNNNYKTLSYIQVGKLTFISGRLTVLSVASPVGYVRITLPFNMAAGYPYYSTFACSVWALNASANYSIVSVANNTIHAVECYTWKNGTLDVLANYVQAASEFIVSGGYIAA